MSEPRLPRVAVETDDARLDAIFSVFTDAGRDVPEIYRVLGNAPAMLEAWTRFAWPLRHDPSTPRGVRELIIMRVAQVTDSPFEWTAHWDSAVRHGISERQLGELGRWRESTAFDDDQRAVLTFTDALTVDLDVDDDTWQALAERHDPSQLVELVLTTSFYSCVSRVLNALRLDVVVDPTDPRLAALRAT